MIIRTVYPKLEYELGGIEIEVKEVLDSLKIWVTNLSKQDTESIHDLLLSKANVLFQISRSDNHPNAQMIRSNIEQKRKALQGGLSGVLKSFSLIFSNDISSL